MNQRFFRIIVGKAAFTRYMNIWVLYDKLIILNILFYQEVQTVKKITRLTLHSVILV